MPVVDMFAHDLLFAPLVTLLANSRHVVVFAYSDWSFSSTWTPCGSIVFFFYFLVWIHIHCQIRRNVACMDDVD